MVLSLRNVKFFYDDFHLSVRELNCKENDKIAVLGENGSGKTTLLNLISGQTDSFEGEILIKNNDIKKLDNLKLAKLVSYLPQFSEIIFGFSVFETVLFGRFSGCFGDYSSEDYEKTEMWITRLELAHLKHRKFNELSGGEQRRVMFARVLNQESDIIVLDEPFSMVDVKFVGLFKRVLKELDKTVIMSVHDINQIKGFCDKVVFMKNGQIKYFLNYGEITSEVLSEIFGVAFKDIDGYFFAE